MAASFLGNGPSDQGQRRGPNPEAVEAYEDGQERFSKADYEGALAAFQRAGDIQPAPGLHYNIGVCYLRLGQYAPAIEALTKYLDEADPPDRGDVEYMIADARQRLEDEANNLDDEASPPPPTESVIKEVYIESKPYRPLIIAGSAGIVVGIVGGTVGGVLLGLEVQERNASIDEFNESGGTSGPNETDIVRLEGEAQRYEALQFVAIGIGAALVAGGVAALVIGLKRKTAASEPSSQAKLRAQPRFLGNTFALRF